MMLEIPGLVSTLLPGAFKGTPTLVRVQTTRPLFLAFDEDRSKPVCVLQVGRREDLERAYQRAFRGTLACRVSARRMALRRRR